LPMELFFLWRLWGYSFYRIPILFQSTLL
jgi:hypothetical protein